MMKFNIISGLMVIFLSSVAFSQNISFPDLQGFKRTTNYPVYTSENLWDFINGAADNYLSYGFVDLHVAEYSKGKNVIKLEIYKQKDNVQAFGIYSTEKSPTFEFIKVGVQGYKSEGSVNFLKGKYYVKIRTYSKSEKTIQTVESLALKVANMLEGDTELPSVLLEFPQEGKKKNEEIFIQESVLGHEFLKGAFKANYEVNGINFSIFIINNKTVEESMNTVQKYLAQAKLEFNDQSDGKYLFTDGYNGNIFLSWKNSRIVIISGLSKDQIELAGRYTTQILR